MNKIIVAAAMVLGMSAFAEDTKTAPAAPAAAATHEHGTAEHKDAPAATTAKMTEAEATKTCKQQKAKDMKACVEKLTKAM